MAIEAISRKWGHSVGLVIPKEVVKKENIKLNEKLLINIMKPANIRHLFGSLKRKMSGQEFKDMVRKGSM
mgnify:CR=1 FL=1